MADTASPVEVGTQGTIGSLVSQEIEYYKRLDLGHRGSSAKPKTPILGDTTILTSASFRPKLGSTASSKKKKPTGSGGFLPSICSVVEIAENSFTDRVAGNGYRHLRTDGRKSGPILDDGL